MKKLILLVCCAFIGTTAMAQNESYWGVRAGYSNAKMTLKGDGMSVSSNSLSSFQGGVSYNQALSQRAPLYLETGLYFAGRGSKIADLKIKANYLQIPVLLSWHFAVGDSFSIQPFVGGYYAFGISGKYDDVKVFKKGDTQILKRSDAGLRMGVGFTMKQIYLGAGYDLGLMNIAKNTEGSYNFKNRAFFVNVGYNF